jgi:hypothetical protein
VHDRRLEHRAEKWEPVFDKNDAITNISRGSSIRSMNPRSARAMIALRARHLM